LIAPENAFSFLVVGDAITAYTNEPPKNAFSFLDVGDTITASGTCLVEIITFVKTRANHGKKVV